MTILLPALSTRKLHMCSSTTTFQALLSQSCEMGRHMPKYPSYSAIRPLQKGNTNTKAGLRPRKHYDIDHCNARHPLLRRKHNKSTHSGRGLPPRRKQYPLPAHPMEHTSTHAPPRIHPLRPLCYNSPHPNRHSVAPLRPAPT